MHYTSPDNLYLKKNLREKIYHLIRAIWLLFASLPCLRLGLDPKLLSKVLNMSSGRCWSSDTYNPVPGVMDGVPSANNYQGGFGTTLMAKVWENTGLSAYVLTIDVVLQLGKNRWAGISAMILSCPVLLTVSFSLFHLILTVPLSHRGSLFVHLSDSSAAARPHCPSRGSSHFRLHVINMATVLTCDVSSEICNLSFEVHCCWQLVSVCHSP